MPFIRGRYHINPVMGEALEAAREAEEALLTLEQQARDRRTASGDGNDADAEQGPDSKPGTGPVHRVEIEAAEVVPSHSGRATRGFVARVHRAAMPDDLNSGAAPTTPPETHVFSDHHHLVKFLGDELSKGR